MVLGLYLVKKWHSQTQSYIMKKIGLLILCSIGLVFTTQAQIYQAKSKSVKFYSHTSLEDISAVDTTAVILLNAATNDVKVLINIKGFDFTNELMEEHFNENYMETDKEGAKDAKGNVTYPNRKATFFGKINEKIDYTKDGTHNVTITGKLTIHNVAQERTVNATIAIKGGVITVDSKFLVALKDHQIEVPSAVGTKIAQNVEVTVRAIMVSASAAKK
jgi:hypothetical protein